MKAYPAYKDSGIEWIGEIPAGWEVSKLKYVAKIKLSNVDKKSKEGEQPTQLCNYTDVYYNNFITNKINFMVATATNEQIHEFSLHQGDVLITKDSETPTDIAVAAYIPNDLDGVICGYHLAHIRADKVILFGKYLFRAFQSKKFLHQFEMSANGITRYGISKGVITNALFLTPPIQEQQAIANYLDRQTQKLDRLIALKEKKIELLKEYRAALINQAVTKGLNPHVKMKDSGIEWLGQIPEHWEVIEVKRISKIKYGLGQPPRQLEGGLPIIRATNIDHGKIVEEHLIYADPNDVPYDRDPILKTNDIIIVRSGAYTGDSAIIPPKYNGAITGYDMVIRIRNGNPKYIAFCFLSHHIVSYQIELNRMRAAQPHLNAEELGEIVVVLPPITEQDLVVKLLDKKTQELDKNIENAHSQIAKLKEYRAALISAAVTGKIDVREALENPSSQAGKPESRQVASSFRSGLVNDSPARKSLRKWANRLD